jgi:hypothetical protein
MTEAERRQATVNRALAERERVADERERLADLREQLADERERLADERDSLADELDRLAAARRSGDQEAAGLEASGTVSGSRLRLRESERGLENARIALARSYALLARQRVATGNEDNAARQQELVIAREMFDSRSLDDARRAAAVDPPP